MMKNRPMYYRRKILLNLISAFGKQGIEKIKLQKLLFLLCQEQKKPAFDFVPYKYGCFSFQANKDLSVLEGHYQLIKQTGTKWLIKQPIDIELKAKERQAVDALLKKFKQQSNNQVVSYVYDNYPYYAIKSEWDMTPKQKKSAQDVKETIKAKNQKCLFTIGYEGRSIDAYLNILAQNNISALCDVRKNPISMKYGFSKNQLGKYCENLGIAYEHIPELGIDSYQRQNLKTKQDYQSLFKVYEKTLSRRIGGLNRVMELLKKHRRVALTCFEKDYENCHRHCVNNYLQKKHQLNCRHL